MTQANHQIVRDFFEALSNGDIPDSLLTPDMTAWTAGSGTMEKAGFQMGINILAKLFTGPYVFTVDHLTAEDDRVAAEAHTSGTLITGEHYGNQYVFMFRIRDGRIAEAAEYTDTAKVQDKLIPLFAQVMAKMAE